MDDVLTELRLADLPDPMETDEKKAALRREAETMQAQGPSENMAAWYFASWLLFFMDAHESAMASWQKSIDGMRA